MGNDIENSMQHKAYTIAELETYFKSAKLPDTIQLTTYMSVLNVRKFVDSHLDLLKANPENERYKPFLDRLNLLRNKLENTTPK